MMMMCSSSRSSNRYNPFTAAQWEELEQQALIYKYMVSGVPVPADLILSVRRSLLQSSSSSSISSSTLYPHQPTLGSVGAWEGSFQYNHQLYQMGGGGGYGRKIDLEPGRCRRTDGKKWRCSKEAYPDSKYCERHMHRGRNRSRKPVEFPSSSSSSSVNTATVNVQSSSLSPSPTTLFSNPISPSSSSSSSYPLFSSSLSENYQNTLLYPSFHPHNSSSRPTAISPITTSIHNSFMESYSHQTLKDYRYPQEMKDVEEHERSAAYFQLNDPFSTTKKMASSSSSHQQYSHFNFQNLTNKVKEQQPHQQHQEEEEEDQHCFLMGNDIIKSPEEASKSINERGSKPNDKETSQKMINKQPFHHFFSPPETTPNDSATWIDIEQQQFTNTSKPSLSTQDLFQSKPKRYW